MKNIKVIRIMDHDTYDEYHLETGEFYSEEDFEKILYAPHKENYVVRCIFLCNLEEEDKKTYDLLSNFQNSKTDKEKKKGFTELFSRLYILYY